MDKCSRLSQPEAQANQAAGTLFLGGLLKAGFFYYFSIGTT